MVRRNKNDQWHVESVHVTKQKNGLFIIERPKSKVVETQRHVYARILAAVCRCKAMVCPKVAEIWDGGDLVMMREVLETLRDVQKIAINMAHVKYLPTGTFGMLYDAAAFGHVIVLLSPQQHIQDMEWFRMYCERMEGTMDAFRINPESSHSFRLEEPMNGSPEEEIEC